MSGSPSIVRAQLSRTRGRTDQLREQLVDVLRDDHPQSVRHLFYRMTDPRLPAPVAKDDSGYRTVQYQLKRMRREGLIPFEWITDATRRGYHVETFDTAADFVRRMAGLYRADAWRDSSNYVEVWCESRSIAGVIADDCQELGVSLYPSGGFTSLSLAYEAASYMLQRCEPEQRTAHVVYVGDFDPSGVLIDRKIEDELRLHLGNRVNLVFNRIAINEDQIERFSLPTKPRKPGDRRSAHIEATVEAEAMPAHLMRTLLRQAVEELMPECSLAVARVAEQSEQEFLRVLARQMEAAE